MGTTKKISAKDSKAFAKEISIYIDSKDAKKDKKDKKKDKSKDISPMDKVRRARVYIRCMSLRTACTLPHACMYLSDTGKQVVHAR